MKAMGDTAKGREQEGPSGSACSLICSAKGLPLSLTLGDVVSVQGTRR